MDVADAGKGWRDLRVVLAPQEDWRPPEYAGSMLRGAFGHALRHLACAMKLRTCTGCPLEFSCMYTTIFETRRPANAPVMRNYARVPHPFLIDVALNPKEAGYGRQPLELTLRLFGEATPAAPFCQRALQEAAQRGLTRQRIPFRLAKVEERIGQGAPAPLPDRVTLEIQTPARITFDGRPMTPERFSPAGFAMAVARRFGLLNTFWKIADHSPDFTRLKSEAARIKADAAGLRWHEMYRHSSRQKARRSVSGLLGRVALDLEDAPGLRAVLAWAPILHVGKNTSMGLGRVRIVS